MIKSWIENKLPAPLVSLAKMVHQYGLRLGYWWQVVVGVRGDSFLDGLKLYASVVAGPLTALAKLNRWQYPLLLFDTNVKIRGGARFSCRAFTDQLFQVTPTAQKSVLEILKRKLQQGGTFVDAGANLGFFTIAGAGLVGPSGTVVAIEMMPETAKRLRHHIKLNNLSNVTVVENALSDTAGQVISAVQPVGSTGQASVAEIDHSDSSVIECKVSTTTLDNISADIGGVDLMKIDVEGHEAMAFLGGKETLGRTGAVVFENWGDDPRSEDAKAVLRDLGFVLHPIDSYNILAERVAGNRSTNGNL